MTVPIIRDIDGIQIEEGATVRILALEPSLLDGLAIDVATFLMGAIGQVGEVDEMLDGDVSVMLKQSNSRYHFIRSPGALLRVLPAKFQQRSRAR